MKLKSKAFTLVEVSLVSSLVAILGIAVFQAFNNGFKLWAKAELLNKEAEVGVFLDKMAEDLRSSIAISGIKYKGIETQLSFPAIVLMPADPKSSRAEEGMADQIGAVQYRFDAGEHTIYRRQASYGQALKGQWPERELPLVVGVNSLTLQYQVPSDKGIMLKSSVEEIIPSGVMVDISYTDDSGVHQLRRYLQVPIAG